MEATDDIDQGHFFVLEQQMQNSVRGMDLGENKR